MLRAILIGMAAAAVAGVGQARAETLYLVEANSEVVLFLDRDSIVAGDSAKASTTIYSMQTQTVQGKQVRLGKAQVEIDCKARKLRALHFALYAKGGAEITHMDAPADDGWTDIVPGKLEQTMFDMACLGKFDDSRKTADAEQAVNDHLKTLGKPPLP